MDKNKFFTGQPILTQLLKVIPRTNISRLVSQHEDDRQRKFEFITNHMKLGALKLAFVYKKRWQIEMLFKRVKRIIPSNTFQVNSENAIKI